ncbi:MULTISPECIES: magnesium transporter MgtE N-terminal domain-containing protein [Paenibacillus]|jgi:flagellar motility protein MotE (MotC chaperone)|uniref:Kinesin n=1 Tax=Paenibacillus polymyxa TaxID=1406 RepID=A0AAP3ZUN6_PAEPO|nr:MULTISPECIES: kinesin [Paenibacillus]APB76420.1 kinesin [Paenibacillus polymyxa]MBP1175825.1 flagellar motility protein MotE (MotC chaperone) [Paenibacillus sp. PvR133]MDH2329528.1 kinesin [Paenibacillus polymyxa]MXO79430.1 kinesin [Paenibacillus sp. OT2-17]OMF74999.1 kinesin [Paenibacillus peoriae]
MAQKLAENELDMDLGKESGGGFERFMFFLIPIVFTIVLVGVLLTLFNMDFRSEMISLGNKIPVVKNWVPEPKDKATQTKEADQKAQSESSEATIQQLKSDLAKQTEELKKATAAKTTQDKKVTELQNQVNTLQTQQEQQPQASQQGQAGTQTTGGTTNEDPYVKQARDLASMYEGMTASKAAPIMENLTTEETVQLLSYMDPANSAKILQKMDAKKAADITMALKNVTPSTDLSVAALQSRLKKDQGTTAGTTSKSLQSTQISSTFASMDKKSGAELILQTYKISPDKALNILNTVDDSTRGSLLQNMSAKDAAQTAKILNKLMGSK